MTKGFIQKEDIDYNEIFSPVVKHTSIRILLALITEYELKLAQLNVKTAFLHEDLKDEIYMIQPRGFKVAGKENRVCRLVAGKENRVWRLSKSLYILKLILRMR